MIVFDINLVMFYQYFFNIHNLDFHLSKLICIPKIVQPTSSFTLKFLITIIKSLIDQRINWTLHNKS